MARDLTFAVRIDGVRETLAAFGRLPRDASTALRERSRELAQTLVPRVRAAAARHTAPQARLVARTVRAQRDRVPVVVAGGTRRLGRHRAPAYGMLLASEFGMNRRSGWYAAPRYTGSAGRQYPRHTGRRGSWFFPTVERESQQIAVAWRRLADDIVREFGDGA